MEGSSVPRLQGDEFTIKSAETRIQLLAFLVGPDMPDGGTFTQRGDRSGRSDDSLDDRLDLLGLLLGFLLRGGVDDQAQAKAGKQGEGAHGGVH